MSRLVRLAPLALLALLALAALRPAPAAAQTAAGTAAAQPAGLSAHADRWQLLMNDGAHLYDVRLVRTAGDTLVVQRNDTVPAAPVALRLGDVDELRLIQASVKSVGHGARGTFGGLAGADDAVYKLSRYAPDERRRIVARIFAERSDETARP